MIDKYQVIDFFNKYAPSWDQNMVRNEEVIAAILDNGGIKPGCDLLDVACGTGVLFPDYLGRKAGSVTAIDISPEMVHIAETKFPSSQIKVICGDVESFVSDKLFDCCMVYNAFPHFPDPAHLIQVLATHLKADGRLSIAHGMSRDKINLHHSGAASQVSCGLMEVTELVKLFEPHFRVDVIISNDLMYQVCGRKK